MCAFGAAFMQRNTVKIASDLRNPVSGLNSQHPVEEAQAMPAEARVEPRQALPSLLKTYVQGRLGAISLERVPASQTYFSFLPF